MSEQTHVAAPPDAPPLPHRKRGIISYIPRAQHLVTEYKLYVQLVALVIFVALATGHDGHLANTLYDIGVDFLGDGVLLPRAILSAIVDSGASDALTIES